MFDTANSYTFPASNATDICRSQTTLAAAVININGNLANPLTNTVLFNGYSRSVRVVADDAADVTVIGKQNNVIIQEVLTTVDAVTIVFGAEIFDEITSVSVNGAITNLTVGTGTKGFFPIVTIPNTRASDCNYTLTLARNGAAAIPTGVYATLANIPGGSNQPNITYLNWITNDWNIFELKAPAASNQYVLNSPNIWKFLLVQLDGDETNVDDSVTLKFLGSWYR